MLNYGSQIFKQKFGLSPELAEGLGEHVPHWRED